MPVIQQPANQIKLTNVSLVRYKKGKKRFELACYKNKLVEYRQGTETDLDNVLQIPTIFLNVSKGETAPNAELLKAWPQAADSSSQQDSSSHTNKKGGGGGGGKGSKKSKSKGNHSHNNDEADADKSWKDAIIEEILQKGEIQVNEGERKELQDRMEREVVEEVRQRLVDPQTKRVYTTGMIQKGLDLLSQQGGHKPAPDSLQHKLGKLNLGESSHPNNTRNISNNNNTTDGLNTPVSATTSGHATPLSDHNSNASKPKSKPNTTTTNEIPIWRGIDTNKSVKVQALDAIKALIAWQPIPVMRARMRLRVTCPTSIAKQPPRSKPADDEISGTGGGGTIRDVILSFIEQVETQDVVGGEEWEVVGFVEPGSFKGLTEFCSGETKGRGKVEVLDTAVVHQDD